MKSIISILLIVFYSAGICISQDEMYHYKTLKKHTEAVNDVAFSPDGKYLVSGSDDKLMLLWDIEKESVISEYPGEHQKFHCVDFMSNGQKIIVGLGNKIRIYDREGGKPVVLSGHSTFVWSFQMTADEKRGVSGSLDPGFWYWDLEKKQGITQLKGHEESTMAVAISKDGKYIASGSRDMNIKIWDAATQEVLHSFKAHTDNIYALEFTHDGKYLLSASRDGSVKLWNVETAEKIRTYNRHTKPIMDIAISPDGRHFLSASLDQTIRLWEISNGSCLYTYIDHEGPVNTVKFSPDGKFFASGSTDNNVIVWTFGKRVVAEFYYSDEIAEEMNTTNLFEPKQKGEKKDEYEARTAKADKFRNELYDKYYKKYLEEVPAEPVKQVGDD
ncbi:MAG: WD40 repeat domain-containing protein [Bacteroidales bacterium]|nr:WD40 repeat domain-containing protein [Bacteroidales bacterium]